MQLNIEIVNVSPVQEAMNKAGKPYSKIEVAYKETRPDGKIGIKGKPLINFTNPEVFAKVQTLKTGDKVVVTTNKDNNGYWQWESISGGVAGEVAAPTPVSEPNDTSAARQSYSKQAPAGKVTGSNYETPIERAARQRAIVAQSAIGYAIASAKVGTLDQPQILELANGYFDYVMEKAKWPE